MAAAETDGGQRLLGTNHTPSVQVPGAVTEKAEKEQMDPDTNAVKSPESSSSPEDAALVESDEAQEIKTEDIKLEDQNSPVIDESSLTSETDDIKPPEETFGGNLAASSSHDLDELMDIGTVDQEEQEAQIKEEDTKMDTDTSQSPVLSNTGSSSPATLVNGTKEKLAQSVELDNSSPALVQVKDEPLDEEYDQALTSSAALKDEPSTPKEDLQIGAVFSVPSTSEKPVNPSPSHMSCCNCKKGLVKGQTAFQRKGSSSVYCSTVCLTATLPANRGGGTRVCHNCQKVRKTYSVKEALALLQDISEGESEGGEVSDFDVDSSDEEDISNDEPEPANRRPVSVSATSPPEQGKDGTLWKPVQLGARHSKRWQSQDVLRKTTGPTTHSRNSITDAQSAFLSLLDNNMLEHIRDCTVAEAHRSEGTRLWELSIPELKAFIALLFVTGAFSKNIETESLWSEEWGLPFFSTTMARNRYREIMRYLRFDRKEDRLARLRNDKFALVTDVWKGFVTNCIRCYTPGPNIAVDEQLIPTKTRCRLTQYMANTPEKKFGIKSWVAADVETKYFLNGSPYLGRDASCPEGQRLGESVVITLMKPFLGKGRCVTVDSSFTSLSLAKSLLKKKTSLVGTINKARRELPPCVHQRGELFSTRVLKNGKATLTVYQAKPKKAVMLLSTLHQEVSTGSDRKRKPETVTFYNITKDRVDSLDQMAQLYTVNCATRRWPVTVFFNILDLAAINAWVLFRQCTGINIPRHAFILQLAKELRSEHFCSRAITKHLQLPQPQGPVKRRQCQKILCPACPNL